MKLNKNLYKTQSGQGLVEYLLIVAFMAIAAISAIQFLGQSVRHKMAQAAGQLGANTQGIAAPQMERGTTAKKDMKTIFESR